MRKSYWTSYELKKMGMNHRSAKAFLRIQRKEIYRDQKYEELKTKLKNIICGLTVE